VNQSSVYAKLKIVGTLAKEGDLLELGKRVIKLVWSTDEFYILRRDLRVPLIPHPQARIPIRTRRLLASDMPQIITEHPSGLLMGVLRSGIPQCYVATTESDALCYLQWLISPENREYLQSIRFSEMYGFGDDSVVLEFAYTFRRFRGLGIMGAALADIAAEDKRAIWAWTYVPRSNVASLRGCRRAGFLPYRVSFSRWRCGFLTSSTECPRFLEPFWGEN
jgi:hypothetical protein